VKLEEKVVLYDVFVVPDYSINLISVHKLIKDNKVVVFDEYKCYVQDLHIKKVLVTGNQIDGLYCGKSSVSKNVCFNSSSVINLWHGRLGHPST